MPRLPLRSRGSVNPNDRIPHLIVVRPSSCWRAIFREHSLQDCAESRLVRLRHRLARQSSMMEFAQEDFHPMMSFVGQPEYLVPNGLRVLLGSHFEHDTCHPPDDPSILFIREI